MPGRLHNNYALPIGTGRLLFFVGDHMDFKNSYAIDSSSLAKKDIQFTTGCPRKPIYHYTSIGGLSGILEKKKLRFTNIRYMNDKDEVIAGIDAFVQQSNFSPEETERIRQSFANVDDQVFVCCFSEGADLLPLWNYYTKEINNQGYNIEFDYKDLLRGLLLQNKELDGCEIAFGKVDYCKNDSTFYGENWSNTVLSSMQVAISQLFLALYEYTNRAAIESNSTGIQTFREIIDKANRVSAKNKPMVFHYEGETCKFVRGLPNNFFCFVKRDCFSSEKEFRIVLTVPNSKLPLLKEAGIYKYRISNGLLIPYLDLKFPENAVKGITISPTTQSDLAERSVQDFLTYCEFSVPDISTFLRKSNVPVRF